MSGPTVLCVMLANGRQEMVNRAVECYRRQNYEDKALLILDTGTTLISVDGLRSQEDIYVDHSRPNNTETIGALRNRANLWAKSLDCDVIAHFDSDDYSSPQRLAEQVALLQSGDFDAVGYNDCLFWDTRSRIRCAGCGARVRSGAIQCDSCPSQAFEVVTGLAWLYRHPLPNYALGTSLLYHRRTWEAKPFADLPQSGDDVCEDFVFQSGLRVKAVSSLSDPFRRPILAILDESQPYSEPRMIASIHGENSRKASYDDALRRAEQFTRVPDWDAYCRKVMQL